MSGTVGDRLDPQAWNGPRPTDAELFPAAVRPAAIRLLWLVLFAVLAGLVAVVLVVRGLV